LSRKIFVFTGFILIILAIIKIPTWPSLIQTSLQSSAFVAAFFLSLSCLRNAASSSHAIEKCGEFLANQNPSKRCLALVLGGHIYGVILSYGAISLLGSLAERGARKEANIEIRKIRTKRMLLAVQRGFIAMTCWSPLTFSIAITTSLIDGSSWSGAAIPCFISALILMALGLLLDFFYKSKINIDSNNLIRKTGSWNTVMPLLFLFIFLLSLIGSIQYITDLRAVAVVMLIVPIFSLFWIIYQNYNSKNLNILYIRTKERVSGYIFKDIVNYKSELILLIMAAFIGTMASSIIAPYINGDVINFSSIPSWLVLVGILWLMPITGQIGMNPILAVYLIAPLLPQAANLGVSPNAIILALTSGWALSGISSPYTASTLLIADLAKITPIQAGLKWNGLFTLMGGLLLSCWVIFISQFL
ncbi:hypothetical protein N9560_01395, partial [Hyphomicrobiales bacterium]|nr:hypothetical protein [Hyphomicrobiales bacterium]